MSKGSVGPQVIAFSAWSVFRLAGQWFVIWGVFEGVALMIGIPIWLHALIIAGLLFGFVIPLFGIQWLVADEEGICLRKIGGWELKWEEIKQVDVVPCEAPIELVSIKCSDGTDRALIATMYGMNGEQLAGRVRCWSAEFASTGVSPILQS